MRRGRSRGKGELGRTPRVGQITSSAGADKAGAIHGASDKHAAYPARDPVRPEDIAATIYQALGLEPTTEIRDPLGRPHVLATGRAIRSILACRASRRTWGTIQSAGPGGKPEPER